MTGKNEIQVGDTVRYSWHACQYLQEAGDRAMQIKSRNIYYDALKAKQAERGMVTKVASSKYASKYYEILWDDGATSKTLPYMIEKA